MTSFKVVIIILFTILLCQCHLPDTQIYALQEFYRSLDGNSWTNCEQRWNFTDFQQNNKLSADFCGLEFGIITENTQTVVGIVFADDNYNLKGAIPSSIYLLPDLKRFILGSNPLISGNIAFTISNVNGRIPKTICNLQNLEVFHLWELNISGSIPECIGNQLLKLTDFELGYLRYLNSSIPASFNNLTNLQLLVFEVHFLHYMCVNCMQINSNYHCFMEQSVTIC